MLVSKEKIELPDRCPKDCPVSKQPFYQGNLCCECPVLICRKTDEGFCLIEPDDYRADWAKVLKAWFDSNCDMERYPELPLKGG